MPVPELGDDEGGGDSARRWTMPITIACALVAAIGVAYWLVQWPVRQPVPLHVAGAPSAVTRPIKVHVTGAVLKPGLYTLDDVSRAADAIEQAGGPTAEGDLSRINLAQFLRDGQQIVVPLRGAAVPTDVPAPGLPRATARATATRSVAVSPAAAAAPRSSTPASAASAVAPSPSGPAVKSRVNVNRATARELEALPGIGPALAGRLIAYREKNGPFGSLEDVERSRILPARTWAQVRDQIEAP
jgi:competence protein ComEA